MKTDLIFKNWEERRQTEKDIAAGMKILERQSKSTDEEAFLMLASINLFAVSSVGRKATA